MSLEKKRDDCMNEGFCSDEWYLYGCKTVKMPEKPSEDEVNEILFDMVKDEMPEDEPE
jgi:hypothetical protein